MQILDRTRLVLRDRLRFSPMALRAYSQAMDLRSRRPPQGSAALARYVDRLAKAARAGTGLRDISGLESRLRIALEGWTPEQFPWDQFFADVHSAPVRKALLLKLPQGGSEKGVLYVAFENQWIRLLRFADIPALARDFDLVLTPTWSPPQDLAFLLALRLWPNRIYHTLSAFADAPAFERLSDRARSVPLLASSWVNPALVGAERERRVEFDIAMIANFSIYKRHFALFQALAQMDPSVRMLLLGTPWEERTRETLLQEAALFGVHQRIVIREGLPDAEMFAALRSAKVCVLMSLVEGSCVAVAESMFADVPVGLLAGANVGSSAFLNSHTGRWLRPQCLAEDLTDFIGHADQFRPRQWMLSQNLDCWASSQILNRHLKTATEAEGRPWTRDLAPFHWRPNARFLRPEDAAAMAAAYSEFPRRYGVALDSGV